MAVVRGVRGGTISLLVFGWCDDDHGGASF
jgi:hypothetical protein